MVEGDTDNPRSEDHAAGNRYKLVGMVDMSSYNVWLKSIGVDGITSSDPSPETKLCN